MADYTIEAVESMPFAQISYVIWHPGRPEAAVVDPGFDVRSILRLLERQGLRLTAILNTHGHVDHIAGNAAMKQVNPEAPLIIGRNEIELLRDPDANLSTALGSPLRSPEADVLVGDGESIEAAGFTFRVREVPGHSPGSVVYLSEEFDPPFAFGGDVLFAGSVGRTDLPGGDFERLCSGIREKLFPLSDQTIIYPGHGPATTIGDERRTNPYVGQAAGLFHPG